MDEELERWMSAGQHAWVANGEWAKAFSSTQTKPGQGHGAERGVRPGAWSQDAEVEDSLMSGGMSLWEKAFAEWSRQQQQGFFPLEPKPQFMIEAASLEAFEIAPTIDLTGRAPIDWLALNREFS